MTFPVTAAKADKENHAERKMVTALLRCFCGKVTSMLIWCKLKTATTEVEK